VPRYNYKAISHRGRSSRGVIEALNEADLYEQLQRAGMELISCSPIKEGKVRLSLPLPGQGIKTRHLIRLFVQLEQMQGAGVPLLSALADARLASESPKMRDVMGAVYQAVSDGASLSEAMVVHPDVFKPLYLSLIRAGENTGDLVFAYKQLIKYLKWLDNLQRMVAKATRYPMILCLAVIVVVVVMMTLVVPEIVAFVRDDMDVELPFVTISLIATSDFFRQNWLSILITPFLVYFSFKGLMRVSEGFATFVDRQTLAMPIIGILIRKISIARYAQTFGAMFAGGINVLKSLRAAGETVMNRVLAQAVLTVEKQVKEGAPLSQAFNESGEFPALVIHMLRVGEETGNLTTVLDQVSEFYAQDVNDTIESGMALIEPILISVMGGLMLWITVGSFWPIYSNLGTLTEGLM
jgi:type IV pilus assembly protein PilC